MARRYQHISDYEKEIIELRSKGYTLKEIGETLGFTRKQVHNFITRYNQKQRNIAAGRAIHKKGRPSKKRKWFAAFNSAIRQTLSDAICNGKQG